MPISEQTEEYFKFLMLFDKKAPYSQLEREQSITLFLFKIKLKLKYSIGNFFLRDTVSLAPNEQYILDLKIRLR